MGRRQHCFESRPTRVLSTDKGKNAGRELGKAEKNGFGYEDGNDVWIDRRV